MNGTTTNGLANKVKQRLTAKQLTVSSTGNSPNPPQATTVIIDTTGGKKPATGAALVKLFGNHLTTQNTYGLTYNADFIVILGADQVPPVTPAPATSQ